MPGGVAGAQSSMIAPYADFASNRATVWLFVAWAYRANVRIEQM